VSDSFGVHIVPPHGSVRLDGVSLNLRQAWLYISSRVVLTIFGRTDLLRLTEAPELRLY
jgi:hypothetical protein